MKFVLKKNYVMKSLALILMICIACVTLTAKLAAAEENIKEVDGIYMLNTNDSLTVSLKPNVYYVLNGNKGNLFKIGDFFVPIPYGEVYILNIENETILNLSIKGEEGFFISKTLFTLDELYEKFNFNLNDDSKPDEPPTDNEDDGKPDKPPTDNDGDNKPDEPPTDNEDDGKPDKPPTDNEDDGKPDEPPTDNEDDNKPVEPPTDNEDDGKPDEPPTDNEDNGKPDEPPTDNEDNGKPDEPPTDSDGDGKPDKPDNNDGSPPTTNEPPLDENNDGSLEKPNQNENDGGNHNDIFNPQIDSKTVFDYKSLIYIFLGVIVLILIGVAAAIYLKRKDKKKK